MKHAESTTSAASVARSLQQQSQTRFPDWHNLPKPKWRDALKALASPATRLHRYRNLRTKIYYEVISDLDCKDRS